MANSAAGHASSGTCSRISAAIWSIRSGVRRGIALPFTRSAGGWSLMPVHDVVSTDTRPSSETLPFSIHRFVHNRSSSAALPARRSMMSSANSTR